MHARYNIMHTYIHHYKQHIQATGVIVKLGCSRPRVSTGDFRSLSCLHLSLYHCLQISRPGQIRDEPPLL